MSVFVFARKHIEEHSAVTLAKSLPADSTTILGLSSNGEVLVNLQNDYEASENQSGDGPDALQKGFNAAKNYRSIELFLDRLLNGRGPSTSGLLDDQLFRFIAIKILGKKYFHVMKMLAKLFSDKRPDTVFINATDGYAAQLIRAFCHKLDVRVKGY